MSSITTRLHIELQYNVLSYLTEEEFAQTATVCKTWLGKEDPLITKKRADLKMEIEERSHWPSMIVQAIRNAGIWLSKLPITNDTQLLSVSSVYRAEPDWNTEITPHLVCNLNSKSSTPNPVIEMTWEADLPNNKVNCLFSFLQWGMSHDRLKSIGLPARRMTQDPQTLGLILSGTHPEFELETRPVQIEDPQLTSWVPVELMVEPQIDVVDDPDLAIEDDESQIDAAEDQAIGQEPPIDITDDQDELDRLMQIDEPQGEVEDDREAIEQPRQIDERPVKKQKTDNP